MKIQPPLWPHPTPGDHDLNKVESTVPNDASTQDSENNHQILNSKLSLL